VQTERCYSRAYVTRALKKAGFDVLGFYEDYDFTPAGRSSDRWYVAARCRKD
jgi:hypothetical protein